MMSTIFRKRDLGVVALICLAIYLSLDVRTFSYLFEPAWYVDQRKVSWSGEWSNVPPVIADLDGDGENEVVLITKDLQLKIVKAFPPNGDFSSIFVPTEVASARLSRLNVIKGSAPVALKTGYTSPYREDVGRQQVIVVVSEDWTVTCFDHKLNALWEKALAHNAHEIDKIIDLFKIDEASIYLAPLSIKNGSTGIVVIGASMARIGSVSSHIEIENGFGDAKSNEEDVDVKIQSKLEHFSMYALNAADGHVLWKHDGVEVRAEQYIRSLPQHAYRLDALELTTQYHHAPGLQDWTVFRQSLIAELPHVWEDRDDTALRIAHFQRRHIGAGAHGSHSLKKASQQKVQKAGGSPSSGRRKTASLVNGKVTGAPPKPKPRSGSSQNAGDKVSEGGVRIGRFTGVESAPLSTDAILPHDATEHMDHPNVIVAHTKKGIEVNSLTTGAPITSLALSGGRSYADLDGDGVVDTILFLETRLDAEAHGRQHPYNIDGELTHCSIVVISGLPARAQLFNGTLCARGPSLQEPLTHRAAVQAHRAQRVVGELNIPDEISAAAPAILRTIDPKTSKESRRRDIAVAVNTGVVTCYSSVGSFKWQVRNGPSWALGFKKAFLLLFDYDATRVESVGHHDSIYANLLAVGDSSMALISKEGDVLSLSDLPGRPISRPIVGDFDSDGIMDVIIVTEDAILGYRLDVKQSTRGMLIAVVGLTLVAIVVFFANIRTIPLDGLNDGAMYDYSYREREEADYPDSRRSAAPVPASKRNVLLISRATDEYHID